MQNYPMYVPEDSRCVERFLTTRDYCLLSTLDEAGNIEHGMFNPLVEGDVIFLHLHVMDPQLKSMRASGRADLVFFNYHGYVPSYARDEQDASYATMFYKFVQAHCSVTLVDMNLEGAAVLERMMKRYQPEGGYEPILPTNSLYKPSLKMIQVVACNIAKLTTKWKLGQNRNQEQRGRAFEFLMP